MKKDLTGMDKAMIFDIQKFSIHDGPGIRTTIFFKGCSMCCIWCQNPESIHKNKEIMYFPERCISCGQCFEVCQTKARNPDIPESIDRELCNLCGECVAKSCFSEALRIAGNMLSVDEVYEEVMRDEIFYRNSGGGVTLSGGEPLMYLDFVKEFIQKLHKDSIHVAVETCGFVPERSIEDVINDIDLFLYDIKYFDSVKHKELTGVSNELVLSNARLLAKSNRRIIFRIPLIYGINDDMEDIEKRAEFISKFNREGISVELLPYNPLTSSKYPGLGLEYKVEVKKMDIEEEKQYIEELQNIFCRAGIAVENIYTRRMIV